jgi:hypothetical protein
MLDTWSGERLAFLRRGDVCRPCSPSARSAARVVARADRKPLRPMG